LDVQQNHGSIGPVKKYLKILYWGLSFSF